MPLMSVIIYSFRQKQKELTYTYTSDSILHIVDMPTNINPNELRGVITSSSGQPINGASVRVKDTAAETITNARGEFRFEIPTMSSPILVISASGYQTKEITVTQSRIYNEVLEPQ